MQAHCFRRTAAAGLLGGGFALGLGLAPVAVAAQTPAQPAGDQAGQAGQAEGQLPPVEIVQKKASPKPEPPAAKPAAKKKPAPPPPAPAPAAEAPAPGEAPPSEEESAVAGLPGAGGGPPAGTVRMAPAGGSEIAIEKVPAGVSVVSSGAVERESFNSVTAAIEQRVPGATVNAALGNALSNDLNFRGFSASPLNGTPQGLAIYQNGVRVNEVFGDAVYWDLIPAIAISDILVITNNPVYGLNALGGAVNVVLKDGFSFQGFETDVRAGSFGHVTTSVQGGIAYNDRLAAYVSGEYIGDDGWRDLSDAQAYRLYGGIAARGSGSEFHLNATFADTKLGVVGPTPVDLLEARRESVFTSPQTFDNTMYMVNLNGTVAVTDTLKVSGLGYYRRFRQRRPDGNVSEAVQCAGTDEGGPGEEFLCLEEPDDLLFDQNGNNVLFDPNVIYGGNDFVSVDSFSTGGALQAVSRARLFERPNQFLAGLSIDYGRANSKSRSELGILDPETLKVRGTGIIIDQGAAPPGTFDEGDVEVTPVDLDVTTRYYGFYVTDTFDLTDALALTVGGRYNIAQITLDDNRGTDLDGKHEFHRFNPLAGATYKLLPGLSVYGGYSEANRAPTPAELACADPERPCLLENFLVSDPPLKQVVANTWEAGFRGEASAGFDGTDANGFAKSARFSWSIGYFHTLLKDDILTAASPIQGRGFFLNAGDTLRQGIEAQVSYTSGRLFLYASYAYVDATFRDAIELASPDNPEAGPCSGFEPEDEEDEAPGCVQVRPGDRIPAIPRHRFKAGFDFSVTPAWKIGADVVAVSSQFFRGDEANRDAPLSGYAVVDLHTSYRLSGNMLLYGSIENLFDAEYETFGTYFDKASIGDAPAGRAGTVLTDPRTVTPAPPRAFYGGVKVRF